MSTMTTQNRPKSIDKGVRHHFIEDLEAKKPQIEKVFQIDSQEDYNLEVQNYSSLGDMPVVAEGANYTVDSALETYNTIYTPIKKGQVVEFTLEEKIWDKAGLTRAANIGRQQANQVRRAIEKQGAAVFNNGFDTAFTYYGDNKPLFSVDHTRADGGASVSNANPDGLTLTHTGVEALVVQMRETLDDRGELVDLSPSCLLVPPALEQEALIVTKSTQRSGSGDNDANPYGMREYTGGQMKVCVWDYLGAAAGGSDTAFFLLDMANHKVTWRWGEKPTIALEDEEFDNDTMKFKARYQAAAGWHDFRGVVGSRGDQQPYTS